MSVNINVLSTFNDAGIKKAQAEMGKLNKSVTGGMSKSVQTAGAMGAGVLGAAGIATAAVFAIGQTFDGAFDSIRANTGKTGDELESLKGSLRTVASTTATSFEEAAGVIGTLSSKLGLTGKPLEDVTSGLINLSNLTGTDLNGNVEAVSKAFQNFGVSAAYQAPALDVLYRASQQSGVSVADLAKAMGDAGPVLRAAGMDFQTSTAFLASLGKAGIDAGDVMPALQKGLKGAADAGKDANTYLNETFDAIKNAPNDTAAADKAFEVFGKSGGKMAQLIREGKLSYDDLKASIAGGDTISQATTDTEDFAEKFTKLKNRIMLAIEPFASRLFDKVGEIMDVIGPKVDQVSQYFQENEDVVKTLAMIIGGVLVAAFIAVNVQLAIMAFNVIAATAPVILIIALIALFIYGLYLLWDAFTSIDWGGVWDAIKDGLTAAWEWIKGIFNQMWGGIQWLWEKFNWLKDKIGDLFINIGNLIVAPYKAAFNLIVKMWNATIGGMGLTVPDWVKYVPGGGAFAGKSFTIPKLTEWAHEGGIVGGMPGANVPMMLQTGEMVLSQDQQAMLLGRINGGGGGNVINVNVTVAPTADKAAIGQAVVESIREYERRSGAGWRAA
jgi:TP901 family phage tail tape measure protein